jgi:hypothetical protein
MENCIVVGSAADTTGHLKCLTKYEKEENWRVFQEILPEFSEEGSQFAYRVALSSDGCKLVVASRGKNSLHIYQRFHLKQPFELAQIIIDDNLTESICFLSFLNDKNTFVAVTKGNDRLITFNFN